MKELTYHNRRRTISAQISRMAGRWPEFEVRRGWTDAVTCVGPVRGFQRVYTIAVIWGLPGQDRPYVMILDPRIAPREGRAFDEIPHLIFDEDSPEESGLCLFDPAGGEWSDHMLIADTTIPWAAKWLYHYELWHYDGVWRGGGVGAESVGQRRIEAVHRAAQEQLNHAAQETAMAQELPVQDSVT